MQRKTGHRASGPSAAMTGSCVLLAKESTTKDRQLIDGASFGPDALKAVATAFEAAWAEIAGHFGHDAKDIEKARTRLARAMLSVANVESRNVDALKRGALQRMALDYRRRGQPPGSDA
jgi:hypothetical protein